MVARAGEAIVFPQDVSQGYRTRATMKALPTAPHHPRPYGLPTLLPAFPTEVDAYWDHQKEGQGLLL